MVGAGALHPRPARLGRRRPAPPLRRRGGGDLRALPRSGSRPPGCVDAELFAWRALDALRRDARGRGATRRCSSTASTTSRRSSSTRSRRWRARCGVDVTVSLPYERGRPRSRRWRRVLEQLLALGRRGAARAAAAGRPLRGRVARRRCTTWSARLFEDAARARAGTAARCGCTPPAGERAEVELVGRARCSSCCARGTEPGDVAVVFRDPSAYASLVEQVFGAYGIPYSIERTLPLAPHGARPRRCSR